MFNMSPEFLKWKDVTLCVLASALSLAEMSFHIQLCVSDGAPLCSPGASGQQCCALQAHAAWLWPAGQF